MPTDLTYATIEHKKCRFLISESPTNLNINKYLSILLNQNIISVVKACDLIYDQTKLKKNGITVYDLTFEDGHCPSENIIEQWLNLVNQSIALNQIIAVHCMSGLGRSPVLVAIALIENGMSAMNSIELIRTKRKHAFNSKQIDFLLKYKCHNRSQSCSCNIL